MAAPSCSRPTEAQTKARARAWRIFRLRGLHSQCHMLSEPYRAAALNAIDLELESIGAEKESKRRDDMRRRYQEIEQ